MKRKTWFLGNVILILALSLNFPGCSQPMDPGVPEDMIYRISLDRETYTVYTPTGPEFDPPGLLEIIVTNTGNQLLEDLAVVLDGVDRQQFGVSPALIPSLAPGESAAVTVSFPQDDPLAALVYTADILVGNGSAARKLPLTYGVFNLTPALVDIDPPLLQVDYEGHTAAAVSTADTDKGAGSLWFTGNTAVAVIDGETGALTVTGAGETTVGFIVSENPLQIKGQKVTVYPPVKTLRPEYPLVEGSLARPSGGTAIPLNLVDIQGAAAGDALVFTKTGGDGVISAFDADTGELTFSGTEPASADLSVGLSVVKAVPEGSLPVYQGVNAFTAKIGPASAALMLSAETINGPEDLWSTVIRITFSDNVDAGAGDVKNGFTITRNGTLLTILTAAINGATISFDLDPADPVVFGDVLSVSYNSGTGTISSAGTPAASFSARPVTNSLPDLAPWLVRAVVEAASPQTLQVVFNEPVTSPDLSKFRVKANSMPRADIANSLQGETAPIMDYGSAVRTVSGAVSAGGDDRAWNLTMSAPAAYGEILILSTTESGAMKDKALSPNDLPQIPQFIIKNGIRRQKAPYEAEAGFYRNGVKVDSVDNGDGDDLYRNVISHLTSSGNYPQANEVLTIVLDSDQTYTGSLNFTTTHIPASLIGGEIRLIVTTKTGNTQDYVITVTGNGAGIVARNGLTVIIDEHVVFDHNNANNNNALIVVNDGGKLILDGGEIRNNVNTNTTERAGGLRMGGGNYGAHFIMNSGKITNNQVSASGNDTTTNHGGAGGIYIQQYGVFVMHGGEISNNTLNLTGTVATPKAGAVSVRYSNNQYHANASIFITGGEIFGNKVLGAKNVVSAGAIYTNGAFQKTGGTIYGPDAVDTQKKNYSEYTGTVNAGVVVIGNTVNANPALSAVTKRDATAGPDLVLLADSYKTANGSAGVNTVPNWAMNFWD
ncbi:MAG: hypothetical protein LBK62_04205 [Treponema sp.]|nr:hypothetical protein [Treponema sp.]